MRPVNRGPHPLNSESFKKYQDAVPYLQERLGRYCSYCERRQASGIDVEHKQPQKHHPELLLAWDNFLLACKNCNSMTGATDVNLEDYFWPDTDNTFQAFTYQAGGLIEKNSELDEQQQIRAQNTLDLTGLQKRPPNAQKGKDDRWADRMAAWDRACDALDTLRETDNEGVRNLVVQNAKYCGNWSVWMTVFKDDKDMRRRLIEKLPGTCRECFDEEGNPIPRPEVPCEP